MKEVSVDPEYKIKIHADANYDEGYIDISLVGETVEKSTDYIYQSLKSDAQYDELIAYYIKNDIGEYIEYIPDDYMSWVGQRDNGLLYIREESITRGEVACTGNFLITRATSLDDYFEWNEITSFTMSSDYPSSFHFYDYTVEQGIQYKYAIQQFNIHGIYSNKVYQTDNQGNFNTTTADFEDMFLSDGIRQLKVRFNPKVTSFKNTIPEQKIETIGSKYPFIFRNGQVCYKEFPIGGLISFQMDNALLFLNQEELKQAGILDYDYFRIQTGIDSYNHIDAYEKKIWKEITEYIYSATGAIIGRKIKRIQVRVTTDKDRSSLNDNINNGLITGLTATDEPNIIRLDRNLTSENMMGERYFKLKVLDWLTDGKIKLFRSPAEGNYLVRLLNVQMTPQDPLGRMLHQFTCTAYEVDELNYSNLVSFGIVSPTVITNYESQWASVDINKILNEIEPTDDGFIKISPEGITIDSITIQDFAPGDQIKIVFDSGSDGIFSIGVTGSLELNNDDRTIIEVWVKPNPDTKPYDDFSRTFYYQTTNIQLTKFDAITDINTTTRVAEQFIGPMNNLLEPYNLRDHVYGEKNEYGVVENPLNELDAFQNVYADLRAHHRFTYVLNETTEKFTGLKIDILHVHKKEVIPIYCYGYDDKNNQYLFGVTPFGIPYVNSTNIINFYNERKHNINYANPVIHIDEETNRYIHENAVHIEDITTVFDEQGVIYNLYDLLKPFYYDVETEQWIPFQEQCFTPIDPNAVFNEELIYYQKIGETYYAIDIESQLRDGTAAEQEAVRKAEVKYQQLNSMDEEDKIYTEIQAAWLAYVAAGNDLNRARNTIWNNINLEIDLYAYDNVMPSFYDLYRHQWMAGNERYDPTFSINEPDNFPEKDKIGYLIDTPEFVGDNNISLKETNDMLLYNIGQVDHIHLGNGVVAEITMQIRVVDYEIEKTDEQTKDTKDAYLKARDLLNDMLDMTMLHTNELAAAEAEANRIQEEIDAIDDALGVYNESNNATTGVMAVAKKRLINQKKKLWYTLEQQLEDILNILQTQKAYLSIDGGEQSLADALTAYEYDTALAQIQIFDEERELAQQNYLYLEDKPNNEETLMIDNFSNTYNIIDDTYLFYEQQYRAIMEKEQATIDKCDASLNNFAVQRGNIVGGFLEDYSDENPPPENTLVYAQFQLTKIQQALDALEDHSVEIKSELINQLLTSVLTAHTVDLTDYTDTYIQENAVNLAALLERYLSQRQNDLDDLTSRYYQKIINIIYNKEDAKSVAHGTALDTNGIIYSTDSPEYRDVSNMLQGTLPNIKRIMTGTSTIAQENDEDILFDQDTNHPEKPYAQGVIKLKMFLEAILTDEQAKKAKNQKAEVIEALKKWIDFLITDQKSYTYTDTTNSQLYTILYFSDDTNTIEVEDEPVNEEMIDIEKVVTDYLNTVKKSKTLGETTYNTNAKIMAAFNASKEAYQNAITFSTIIPTGKTISPAKEQQILRKYYEEPTPTTDNNGFTVFTVPVPDYNENILKLFQSLHPLMDAYYAAYQLQATEIQTEISNYTSQKILLDAIAQNPGYIDRAFDGALSQLNQENFVEEVEKIRDDYLYDPNRKIINGVYNIINNELRKVGKTLYDFTELTADSTENEKASVLLQLLIDEYNKNPANSVQSYLNRYLGLDVEEEEYESPTVKLNKIIDKLNNADAVYKNQLAALKKQQATYEAEEAKYSAQIKQLEDVTKELENTRALAQNAYNAAQREIDTAVQASQVTEGSNLINRIAANSTHQKNVAFVSNYLTWLQQTQTNLLTQIGQIFSDVDEGNDYAKLMLEYINAYEVEAFKFLHYEKALEEDLHEGFYGNDGIDWLYSKPNEYWLSSYKDIYFFKETKLTNMDINELTSNRETIRTGAYEALKSHLQEILLDSQEPLEGGILPNHIILSILVTKNSNNEKQYRLVKIKDNGDPWYPAVYEINDIAYENNISLNPAIEYLLPNSLGTDANDREFRPAIANDDGDYIKDPRATTYYTYDSTIDLLIPAFDKDFNEVTDAEFAEVAAEAKSQNKPIQWLTNCKPVQIVVDFHQNLANTFTYMEPTIEKPNGWIIETPADTSNMLTTGNEVFLISPDYYTHFDNTLGLIVHDTRNGEEKGSWTVLKDIDMAMWGNIALYFTLWAYYENLSYSGSADLQKYKDLKAKLTAAENELDYYKQVVLECQTVLNNYNAQGNNANDKATQKEQLIILLEAAQEEVDYYTDLVEKYKTALDTMLLTNAGFREYSFYNDMIPDCLKEIKKLQSDFVTNYDLYSLKVDHYLKLLFNNQPYGQRINRNVLQDFGLAYALEAYKRNYHNSEKINFSEITNVVDQIDEIVNHHYQLTFDDINDYITVEQDENGQTKVRTYFYKDEDGKYIQYRYVDDEQWNKDKENLNLCYTYYPSLIDFADHKEYQMITDNDAMFDLATQYYIYKDNEYLPVTVTPDTWTTDGTYYILKGNGGLNAFLSNLFEGSPYIQNIKDNYNGTLQLYYALLAQSLGDNSMQTDLENQRKQKQNRLDELKEKYLQYKDASEIDVDALITDIYEKLAWYLVTLTNAYINLVERSYGVI